MNGITLALVLLSASPLLVVVLHVSVGLAWRADFLLGRLDTVRDLSKNASPNLQAQIVELFNHVRGFSTHRKLVEIVQEHRFIHPSSTPESPDAFEHLLLGPTPWTRGWLGSLMMRRYRKGIDSLRYFLPALFLGILYFVGFQMILLRCQVAQTQDNTKANQHAVTLASSKGANRANDGASQGPAELDWNHCWKAMQGDEANYLIYAFLGSFVFNTGIMVRRIFVWDISGQMFWWAAYRIFLSLGLTEVLESATNKIDHRYYFLVAAASVSIFDSLVRSLRAKLFQSEAVPKQTELSLQLIQGIDYWKEQRLMEEGIESIQHLATSDFVLIALHTRTPLFTIMDWVDQAIFIQRFPGKALKVSDAGLPLSAVELTWGWDPLRREIQGAPQDYGKYEKYLAQLQEGIGSKPEVIVRTLEAWRNDNQVQLLTLFWQADLGK